MANQTNKELIVRIISPHGIVYEHHAIACSVRAIDGGMTLLANHTPIMAALEISPVQVRRTHDDIVDFIAISGGVMQMSHNVCEIITSFAIRARDIDEARVELDKQEAEAEMRAAITNEDSQAFKRAKIALERAINMISISKNK